MKISHILIGTTLAVGGYYVGKLVGSVKTIKFVFDVFEEDYPGCKKHAINVVADKVIDAVFDE